MSFSFFRQFIFPFVCWLGSVASVESSTDGGTGAQHCGVSQLSLDFYKVDPFLQFNECILLFSDMPAVDIDNVVSTSMEVLKLHLILVHCFEVHILRFSEPYILNFFGAF